MSLGPVGDQGFSKDDARGFIHLNANHSLGKMIQYTPLKGEARISPMWRWLEDLTEKERLEIEVPVVDNPESWHIVVVGADRAKDCGDAYWGWSGYGGGLISIGFELGCRLSDSSCD